MKNTVREQVEQRLLENYEKYYKLAYSYVRNEADALDIVQESAYKAIKSCDKLKEEVFADTWMYRIVFNTTMDFLRKAQREAESAEEYLDMTEGVEETGYDRADIMTVLATLTVKERSVLILRYFESLKLEQIADVMGESLSTVKSRLYRAQEKLKWKLE